jgi:hypothetical protein
MRPEAMSKSTKPAKPSITDRILNFCASGRFGVREAIAAVTLQKNGHKKPLMRRKEFPKTE